MLLPSSLDLPFSIQGVFSNDLLDTQRLNAEARDDDTKVPTEGPDACGCRSVSVSVGQRTLAPKGRVARRQRTIELSFQPGADFGPEPFIWFASAPFNVR